MYWVTPALVLILYICVMAVFFWLQRIHDDSVMFVTIDQEMRQQRLLWVVLALSCVIIISLLMLWRYTRFRSTAEAALIAETGFRRAMENSMSTGMRVLDMEGRIAYVNPAFCRMIGWNEADLIGRSPPFPYWVPGRHEQHQHTLDVLMSGKTPSSGLEVEAQRRDGSRFTARMYVSPLLDPNGNQIGWMTSMTDITEPKRIREARPPHERFMTVLEGLDDAISVTADTHDGLELLFANRTYRRVFGAQTGGHDELLAGRRGRFTDESVEVFAPSVQRWFEVHHRMLAWTDGRRVRMQVARDITERRTHEEASRVQQEKIQLTSRLTTMGEMASSLAHELNQPDRHRQLQHGRGGPGQAGHTSHAAAGAGKGRLAGRARRQDHQPHPRIRETQRAAPPARGHRPHRRQRHRLRRDRRAQAPHPHRQLRAVQRAGRAGRPDPDRTGAAQPAQERPGSHGKERVRRAQGG